MKQKEIMLEKLVGAAMKRFMWDSDYENESIPEIKYNRDALRKEFKEILKHGQKSRKENQ